jgi:hypothetical protein
MSVAHFGNREMAAHQDEMACGLHFLERRLVNSYTTVVIPFDERVIFINLPNCAKFSRWHSEVAQTLDAISGTQLLSGGGGFDKRWLLGTV